MFLLIFGRNTRFSAIFFRKSVDTIPAILLGNQISLQLVLPQTAVASVTQAVDCIYPLQQQEGLGDRG